MTDTEADCADAQSTECEDRTFPPWLVSIFVSTSSVVTGREIRTGANHCATGKRVARTSNEARHQDEAQSTMLEGVTIVSLLAPSHTAVYGALRRAIFLVNLAHRRKYEWHNERDGFEWKHGVCR